MSTSSGKKSTGFSDEQQQIKRGVLRTSELEYLADMLNQLRDMSFALEEKTLTTLLDLAATEAKLRLELEIERLSDIDFRRR